MESIKAHITGDGIDSSVEFSIEEAMARNPDTPWEKMSAAEQEEALKNYALLLFSRQNGITGDLSVALAGGSFSKVRERDI